MKGNLTKWFVAAGAMLGGLAFVTPANAAYDMYLKIDGISGEATASGEAGNIQLTSFSWGVAQPGQGKLIGQEFTAAHMIDKASGALLAAASSHQQIAHAELHVRLQGGSQAQVLKITLSNVRVVAIHQNGEEKDSGGRPREHLALRFEKVEFAYQPLDNAGKPSGSPIVWTSDLAKTER
jgi:type VI secretion system secreted protein Hcp